MRTSEIRTRWLDYFAANGHEIRPSVSLISPEPSILFTIAGMVPFMPYILGTEPAPWPRAAPVTSCRLDEPLGHSRPRETGESGSPSICTTRSPPSPAGAA